MDEETFRGAPGKDRRGTAAICILLSLGMLLSAFAFYEHVEQYYAMKKELAIYAQ